MAINRGSAAFVGISHQWPSPGAEAITVTCASCGVSMSVEPNRSAGTRVTWKLMVYGVCPGRLPDRSNAEAWVETVREVAAYEPDRLLEALDLAPEAARKMLVPADLSPALSSVFGTDESRMQALCALARLGDR